MSYENVRNYFEGVGLGGRILVLGKSSATVQSAADAVGCEAKQIVKTLSFWVDGSPALVVAAGNVKISNQKFKARFNQKPKMIPGELLEEYVGHDQGGVCPFAVRPGTSIYLDVSLRQNKVLYPGAGSENNVVRLSLDELEQHSSLRDWVDVCTELAGHQTQEPNIE